MLKYPAEQFNLSAPERVYFSPGRVNLIGEHLDYNGGHVMPCAIDLGNTFYVKRRNDRLIKAASVNFSRSGVYELSLDELDQAVAESWQQYLLGSIRTLVSHGAVFSQGFELVVEGDLPGGAGLSSSASVVTGYLYTLNDLFRLGFSRLQLALMAQQVEHEHIGVQCGIMDMYAILFGEKDYLVYLDTSEITHELVPLILDGYQLVISNTNKRRRLQDSDYNERRESCDLVSKIAGKELAKISLDELAKLDIPDLPRKRAEFVIQEESRTRLAKEALSRGDVLEFGELMNQSHFGLKDQFEVTGEELDTLSQACRDHGAIGSRMTGAGFGGCVVSLFPLEGLTHSLEEVSRQYEKHIGYAPTHYLVSAAAGTKEMDG